MWAAKRRTSGERDAHPAGIPIKGTGERPLREGGGMGHAALRRGRAARLTHWNSRGRKKVVWRCVSRLHKKDTEINCPETVQMNPGIR